MNAIALNTLRKRVGENSPLAQGWRSQCDICCARRPKYAIDGHDVHLALTRGFNPIALGLNTAPQRYGVEPTAVYEEWLRSNDPAGYEMPWVLCDVCLGAVSSYVAGSDRSTGHMNTGCKDAGV